ncbi:hypothetical protein E4T48_00372 [Aureobasidium sp. EXF-10727]|nr:hypothetical protein E4T48_00372 [Aureobasidium sp. EXF-10727]KAI4729828.1 hypothetical protein E4T49_02425 [Aureobasidium sp. EXF-10728]
MKTFTLAGLLASPLAAMAAPAWIMYAYNESVPEIHGKPINADSGFFWINKDAAAVCPDYDPECPAANTTIVSGPVYGNGPAAQSTYWFLGILQSGGQQFELAGLDGGSGGLALKYAGVDAKARGVGVFDVARDSPPHMIVDNSTVATLGSNTIRVGHANPSNYFTWMACPYPVSSSPASLAEVDFSKPMTIHYVAAEDVDARPYCVRMEITLKPTTLAAPQYYFCKGCEWRCDDLYGQTPCDYEGKPACLEPYCGPYTEESKADRISQT